MLRWIDRALSALGPWRTLRKNPTFRWACGFEEVIWTRKVPDDETRRLVAGLEPGKLSVLEVSGEVWRNHGFARYRNVQYPPFDLCAHVLEERFDLVIAEHVFEHLLWPMRAGRNLHAMLRPGGHALVVTPFIYKVHPNPHDCSRWTETGLKHLLAECGFPLDAMVSGSWGNRDCIEKTFRREFRLFNRWVHSLENDPELPMVVWVLARRGPSV